MKHIVTRLDTSGDTALVIYDDDAEAIEAGISAEANAKAKAEADRIIAECLAKGGVALKVGEDGKAGGHVKSVTEAPSVVLIPKVVAG